MIGGIEWYLMSALFIPTVALVSFLFVAVAAKLSGLYCRSLSQAIFEALETLGVAAFFFGLNVSVGILILDLARLVTHGFLSHYMVQEWTVPCFSLFQALVVKYWIDWKKGALDRECSRNNSPVSTT